jgi:hypothetical protein
MCRRFLAGVAAVLALPAAVAGHHAIGNIYDAGRRVVIEGVVTGFRFAPPHPFVEMEVTERGATERWRLELDNHFELVNVGMTADTLKAGDRIHVSGSGSRNRDERSVYVRSLERRSDGFLYEQVGSSPRVRMRR